ncbi:MAG: methylenetetrahydrofolate reductase C-terminal domain-containing protein [Candidatus Aminicenantes bacterium]|nr:methylenetetrahydrofolate reductase C-terminal domain-containing protein [Candidatus Aminicenantes bacterium]
MKPFLLLAELVPAQADDVRPIERFLLDYAAGKSKFPAGVRLAGITLPQNPRGNAMLDPVEVYSIIASKNTAGRGLWADLDVILHVTGKDQNADALRSSLLGLRALGLTTVLAITGDKPASGKRVFELDSIGLLELISELNFDAFQRTPVPRLAAPPASSPLVSSLPPAPGVFRGIGEALFSDPATSARGLSGFAAVPQFFALAAVSPFKYTEASLLQQYFKLGKKIRAGASALLMQMGWDSRKSGELFRYLRDARIDVPVFGNVYYLTNANPAVRLMHDGQIPGCYVSDELLAAVRREKTDAHLERAACQVAMYRDFGAAGVDLGGLPDFDTLAKIVVRAKEIGTGWRERREILDYPPPRLASGKEPFYLYGAASEESPVSSKTVFRPAVRRRTFHQRHFDFLHRNFLTKGKRLGPAVAGTARLFKSLDRGEGLLFRWVRGAEGASKSVLFNCEDCGDCFLPENFSYCTLGDCDKGLPNPPCGDATPDGQCGNNVKRVCVAESIYLAAAAAGRRPAERIPGLPIEATGGIADLAAVSHPPRIAALEHSSAVLNYLFDRDHTRRVPLIQIAELLHASIPRTAAAMKEVIDGGLIGAPPAALRATGSAALGYLVSLIKMQVKHGAAFIDVNVDALSDDNLEFRKEILRFFVRLIREHSSGVPVCVDSGSPDMLEAGLAAWYEGSTEEGRRSAVPLLNSIKTYTMERLLPLAARNPYRFIGLLVDEKTAGRDGAYGVEELLALARELFQTATGRFGFAPSDIFFDSTVFPLSIDVPMDAEKPGYTYRAFETIRRLKSDPAFKGVHFSLGVTNSVRDLPGRRTGVCRAYLARAMDRGLDAGIVNVFHDYGKRPAAPDLLAFVDAFASQDGAPASVQRAIDAMMDFCRANRTKPQI